MEQLPQDNYPTDYEEGEYFIQTKQTNEYSQTVIDIEQHFECSELMSNEHMEQK